MNLELVLLGIFWIYTPKLDNSNYSQILAWLYIARSIHYQKCIANKQPTTQLSQYSSLISHDIYYYCFQNGLKA